MVVRVRPGPPLPFCLCLPLFLVLACSPSLNCSTTSLSLLPHSTHSALHTLSHSLSHTNCPPIQSHTSPDINQIPHQGELPLYILRVATHLHINTTTLIFHRSTVLNLSCLCHSRRAIPAFLDLSSRDNVVEHTRQQSHRWPHPSLTGNRQSSH